MDMLQVEKEKCIGCGACISIDAEHFDWDDDGLSMAVSNNNLRSENLTEAIESCPTGAIRLAKADESDEFYDGNIEVPNDEEFNNSNVMASENKETA